MPGEVWHNFPTGETLYFCTFQRADGNVFLSNGESDEVWGTSGDADFYDMTMTEDGVGGHYVGDFDSSIAAGVYRVTVFLQAGANPADTDTKLAQGEINWDGSAEINIFTLDTTINDDVIGEDNDTLETLSDQLDGLTSSAFKKTNVYGVGE